MRMTRFRMNLLLAFLGGAILAGGIAQLYFSALKTSAAALADALEEAGVTEDVVYNGRAYSVIDGEIIPAPETIKTEHAVLHVAYAKRVLRVAPPFALPGADMDMFAVGIDKLTQVERSFRTIDLPLIDRLLAGSVFFPDKSLRAAYEAETARRTFLSSGDYRDLMMYFDAAARIPSQYLRESYLFEAAFRYFAPDEIRYVTERHSITKENTRATLRLLRDRMRLREEALEALHACIRDPHTSCDSELLDYPVVDVVAVDRPAADATLLAQSLYDVIAAHGVRPDVFLSDGYCQNLEMPQIVGFTEDAGILHLREGADIRFLRPSEYPEVEFFRHFIVQDFPYIPSSPFSHYSCAAVAYDLGLALATLSVRDFARAHDLGSALDGMERSDVERFASAGSSGIVYEEDARAYVRAAVAGLASDEVPHTHEASLLELALLFIYRTAGADDFVRIVASAEANNVRGIAEGSATHVAIDRAFFTRTSFIPLSTLLIPDVHPKEIYESFSLPRSETPYRYLSTLIPHEISLEELAAIFARYHSSP